jgi:CO/xanthine dehydrogenase Mo-binding subunit
MFRPRAGVLSHLSGLKSAPQQAVAAVVADSRAAEDAAEQVVVDYEELEPVADMRTALAPAMPIIYASLGTIWRSSAGSKPAQWTRRLPRPMPWLRLSSFSAGTPA